MVAPGSTALTMSCRVRPATATAVSASISTPVRPVVRAVASTVMDDSVNPKEIFTEERAS